MEVANIYDNGPISPVCKIKENMAIWTTNQWDYFKVDYIEGLPRSSQSVVEMITVSGVTQLAANGTIAKIQLAPLLLNEGEFLHLRWEPIDDVEGVLWEQPSQGRFATRAIHARVNLYTWQMDPELATTTFFLLGRDRLMNLEVRNPNPVIIFVARFVFWGYRYLVEHIDVNKIYPELASEFKVGNQEVVRARIGTCTWIPTEGKG